MLRPRLFFGLFLFVSSVALFAEPASLDYSQAGFSGGELPLPEVAHAMIIEPSKGDATAAIQSAIDKVSSLAVTPSGLRGAILLKAGVYPVSGQLQIRASGVVLRGENATLVATGQSRRALILISGSALDRKLGIPLAIGADAPVGGRTLKLAKVDGLSIGQRVLIRRPSTKEWAQDLGMDKFPGNFPDIRLNWVPGSREIEWDRTIIAIDAAAQAVTFDAPITTALEAKYGNATAQTLNWPSRLQNVGVENLTLQSEFDSNSATDEEHAWIGIQIENTENAWVRDVTARHFVSAAVWLGTGTRAITVQDCRSEAPVGADAGWRRFGFYVGGQQILVQRCTADGARHPFLVGHCAAGPNVFFECVATHATGDSGSIESWASGTLFDNVKIDGGSLVLGTLGERFQGAGWNAANSMAWNCTAKKILAENPPGASNQNLSDSTKLSLYRTQLAARQSVKSEPASNRADSRPPTSDLQSTASGQSAPPSVFSPPVSLSAPFGITNGRFTIRNKVLFGTATSNAWWKGQAIPARAAELGWSATRWVPGKTGPGLTEDLSELATRLAANGNTLVHVWPGLWYDRRRDSHLTISQPDADVCAPFYETPWARSGQGTAADGLSKYDLTKFNPWYWNRLREFATECAHRDMILYHHFYNHHNFVEAAAHWAEFPWRSANCIQETGFTEPPPFTNNGSRIGIVADFYDISHPVRRELHRLFIWHGLDAFDGQPNVIHTLAFQFAGPLSFQQFFLDTVAEWQAARGKRVFIVLNTSKAITDAILADPKRASLVAAVDQRYWQYLADGSLFAPHSDGKTAFREDRTAAFGKDLIPQGTAALVYKQVREYRDRFPDKAIIAPHAGQGPVPILMAGGAMPLLADYAAAQPLKNDRDDRAFIAFVREHLGDCLAELKPVDTGNSTWLLANENRSISLYFLPEGESAFVELKNAGTHRTALWCDAKTGAVQSAKFDRDNRFAKPSSGAWLLLLKR
ncbi:MAG: DUF6298 domain-containing protein [Nibricoccus sp.]